MLKQFGGVVKYMDWYHVDSRSGKNMFIDMTHLETPGDKNNCESFEFATVKNVLIGSKPDRGNFLLAFVGQVIYAYKIKSFLPNGMMEKTLTIYPAE